MANNCELNVSSTLAQRKLANGLSFRFMISESAVWHDLPLTTHGFATSTIVVADRFASSYCGSFELALKLATIRQYLSRSKWYQKFWIFQRQGDRVSPPAKCPCSASTRFWLSTRLWYTLTCQREFDWNSVKLFSRGKIQKRNFFCTHTQKKKKFSEFLGLRLHSIQGQHFGGVFLDRLSFLATLCQIIHAMTFVIVWPERNVRFWLETQLHKLVNWGMWQFPNGDQSCFDVAVPR